MKAAVLESLIRKYTEKADHHGLQAILGPARFKKYNLHMEKLYDRLVIKIGEKYLKEVKNG